MPHFEKNMALLASRDPRLAAMVEATARPVGVSLEKARNGEPTVRLCGAYLHSLYDPSKEAEEWAESYCAGTPSREVTVLGLGLGRHLRALAARGIGGAVIEPDMALLRLAMESADLSGVLDAFRLVIGERPERIRRRDSRLLERSILPHPPSVRLHPGYFNGLAGYAGAMARVKQGGMKILVVNPIYGGSLPAARHCVTALRQMGHEVENFDSEAFGEGMRFCERFALQENREEFRKGLASLLTQGVELKARECAPDMVLALAQAPLMPETLANLRAMGVPSAFWFVEDFRVLNYWRDLAPHYSWFFGIQDGEFPAELKKIGVERCSCLPTAASPEIHRPMELSEDERREYGGDLSFVGAGYYNRQRFFRGVLDYDFRIWGSDWPADPLLLPFIQKGGARIDTETCVRIFNASRVNLNLHSSTYHEGVAQDGDFVNPRTFEIASCGAFQLVDRRAPMKELFEEGELETFGGMEELREKANSYLSNESARRSMAEKGMKRVLAEHTYRHRMEELLCTMVMAFPELGERQRGRLERRESLMADLERQEGLEELLGRVPQGKGFRMDDIFKAVGNGKGKLSRAEKIFLMMKNIPVVREVRR